MTIAQLQEEVANGGRFVMYTYCISLIVLSFRHSSPIYFIKSSDNAFCKGLPFTLLSLVFGWWGIPWGVFYTLGALVTNTAGGRDVTTAQMNALHRQTGGHVFEFEASKAVAL